MQRDMDLLRTILLELERHPYDGRWPELSIPGRSEQEISYHVRLLDDAGFVEAIDLSTLAGICWRPRRVTYQGHEFLDAARNDTRWTKAKDIVRSATGTLTLEGLKLTLEELLKKSLASALGGL